MDGRVKLYTLDGLAKKEGSSANYLRTVIKRLKKAGKDLVWRDYKFFMSGREWFACHLDQDIEFIE